MPEPPRSRKVDFFVSRTGADASWAQWIAWQLEATGYKVVIQDWDFGPGVNFIHKMQQACTEAERTIAVLSPRYFQSHFTEAEWTAAFYRDPTGEKGLLLPIRIAAFEPPGMFGPRTRLDLFDLDPDTARQHLLDWIARAGKERLKPSREPAFPGTAKPEPNFPGRMPPIFRLPARNPNFTGREALLKDLHTQLAGGGQAVLTSATRPVATYGLGGTGKSHLAIEYAWRWAADYTRVIWMRAETPQTLGADFDALADELRLFDGDKPPEQAKVIEAVRTHLQQNPGWLLILDNVPEPRAVDDAVPRAGGQVICTSRYTAWGKHAAPLRVDVWLPEEAARFLLQRVGENGEAHAAAELAEELGRLPLALEHAAAYCEQSRISLAGYLDRFRRHRLKLFAPERLGDADLVTVTTTWSLSMEAVCQECPGAADLLQLTAWVAPDRFPLDVLAAGAEDLPESLAATVADELALDAAVARLSCYSLVWAEDGTLSVHRLVQEVTRERLAEDEKTRWLRAALKVVNDAFPDRSDDVRTWPVCARLAPHASAVLHHAEPLKIEPEVLARVLNQLALYAAGRADYSSAEPLYQRALATFEKTRGPDHPDTSSSLNNLAELYRTQGRYRQAEPLYQRALDICEKALGPHHRNTATSLNNLALLYHAKGRYDQAEPLYQRALDIWDKALGPGHPDTAASLNNLAELYRAQGRYEEADPLVQRALDICEKTLGPHHRNTANSLNSLALLYHAQGRYEQADQMYQRALDIKEQMLGPDHPDTATSLNNLANLYHAQGRYDQAESLYQRALAISEKVLGPHHPDTATSLNNLALLYRTQDRYDQAEPLYQRALDIMEQALGPDHATTAASLSNLALLYYTQGRNEQAEPLLQRALAIREKARGLHHPDTATSLNNLANLYRAQGRNEQAEPLYQRALAIYEKALGPDHPDTATVCQNLANLQTRGGSAT